MHRWARIGLVALLALGGCNTTSVPIDLDGSAASIKRSINQPFAVYDMADGEAVNVSDPRDFGWAICGGNACVRKADIRGVHFRETHRSLSPQALLMAPVIGVVTLGLIQPTVGGDAPKKVPTAADVLPECAQHRDPAPPAAALATHNALIEWVWSNQTSLNSACLRRAVAQLAPSDEARAVRLNMLAAAKRSWSWARCQNWAGGRFPLVPSLPGGYGRGKPGDPRWLDWASEIISDPNTFGPQLEDDACAVSGGIAPEAEWDARRKLLISTLDPFNRIPGATGSGDGSSANR